MCSREGRRWQVSRSQAVWGLGDGDRGQGRGGVPSVGSTWAGAMRVLGGLVTLVMAVIFTITLPLAGAQAAAVGASELIGAAGRVL